MMRIDEIVNGCLEEGMRSFAIVGHVRPDGDCVGSTCALYQYLTGNYPELQVDLYLEFFKDQYSSVIPVCAKDAGVIRDTDEGKCYDFLFMLDCAACDRIGVLSDPLTRAKKTMCIDHHISNSGYADINVIDADACSASQVLFELLDENRIDTAVADCLMTGIVHDTGVFRHQNTKPRSMEIATELLKKGAALSRIVNDTYYMKSFTQLKIMGFAMEKAYTVLDGRVIVCVIGSDDLERYGATAADLDGIVDQLRGTMDVECAVFIYQTAASEFKVSLRSNRCVNVSEIASSFGGGGHVRAAGYTAVGCSAEEAVETIVSILADAMKEEKDK